MYFYEKYLTNLKRLVEQESKIGVSSDNNLRTVATMLHHLADINDRYRSKLRPIISDIVKLSNKYIDIYNEYTLKYVDLSMIGNALSRIEISTNSYDQFMIDSLKSLMDQKEPLNV